MHVTQVAQRLEGPIPDFSAVVPVYRGRDTLKELCARLTAFFQSRGSSYEIILVDDGSSDGSWQVIEEIAHNSTGVIGMRLMRNFGQHNATNCGLAAARGEFVITLDEDLQHPPEEIARLIECQQREGADAVYGVPARRQHRWWRRVGSRLVMTIPRYVMGITFDISSFRLIRQSVAEVVAAAGRHDIIIDVYIGWATNRIAATTVAHVAARPSGYGPYTLAVSMVNLLYNYTVLPLQLAVVTGALMSIGAFGLAVYFIVLKLFGGIDVAGFTAVIVTVLFSTGLMLLSIGTASAYLARVFLNVNRKPQWIIRESTGDVDDDHR